MSTAFQKLAVYHVPRLGADGFSAAPALDYASLKSGGFETVYFRPDDHAHGYLAGVDTVAARISFARSQGFGGCVWFADPLSADSAAFGIPSDAIGFGNFAADFVAKLAEAGSRPDVVSLNIELSGKGYPPSARSTSYLPWSYCVEHGHLWQTNAGGSTGAKRPAAFDVDPPGNVTDGTVVWRPLGLGYACPNGWFWNESASAAFYQRLAAKSLSDQAVIVQPMGEDDFNYGAWYRHGARVSPECYSDEPYLGVTPNVVGQKIGAATANRYVPIFNGGRVIDRRLVHPTLGAYGQGAVYVPQLRALRAQYVFGFALYPHDGFRPSDFTDYREFRVS